MAKESSLDSFGMKILKFPRLALLEEESNTRDVQSWPGRGTNHIANQEGPLCNGQIVSARSSIQIVKLGSSSNDFRFEMCLWTLFLFLFFLKMVQFFSKKRTKKGRKKTKPVH